MENLPTGLSGGNDLLSLVREKNDEIVFLTFLGGFVESAQGMKIVGRFQDRIDVETFALKFLRHGETDDFSSIDLGNGKGRLVGAED